MTEKKEKYITYSLYITCIMDGIQNIVEYHSAQVKDREIMGQLIQTMADDWKDGRKMAFTGPENSTVYIDFSRVLSYTVEIETHEMD